MIGQYGKNRSGPHPGEGQLVEHDIPQRKGPPESGDDLPTLVGRIARQSSFLKNKSGEELETVSEPAPLLYLGATLEACVATHSQPPGRFTQVSVKAYVPLMSFPFNCSLTALRPVTIAAFP
jgi:hypothetical protein